MDQKKVEFISPLQHSEIIWHLFVVTSLTLNVFYGAGALYDVALVAERFLKMSGIPLINYLKQPLLICQFCNTLLLETIKQS